MVDSSIFSGQIGQTAGAVWRLLDQSGPLPITQIIKQLDPPRDVVLQSIGWLAREEKLTVPEEGRRKIASLRC
jgi:hypothetical protein